MRVGIIGGGLCGLSAAIRLAQRDIQVDLFEAAPAPGGRTRSFFEHKTGQWIDNGPHLLSGAYRQTLELLNEAGIGDHITWQKTLHLALWHRQRGHFHLQPSSSLPLALALPLSCCRMPGHDFSDILSMLRLATHLNRPPGNDTCVQSWLEQMGVNRALMADMLEPLCLGAMNEVPATANAASFARVLREAFANHAAARLGWFNKPLSEALIDPLVKLAQQLGVALHTNTRMRTVQSNGKRIDVLTNDKTHRFDAAILALPLRAANQLLGISKPVRTRRITNIHMWFNDMPALAYPFIGGIGTCGHWFFDVSAQMIAPAHEQNRGLRHICCVISADLQNLRGQQLVNQVSCELAAIVGAPDATAKKPQFVRIVSEHHATTSVSPHTQQTSLPPSLINACEAPLPGDLPATIESAVLRGQNAAEHCCLQLFS
ncbi:MAG: FAD-dependent oxidoreductase [Mariprofundaceae bacterium]|nr:FAD-dependent oxidoreductase [Mariprofundaceae bacterium]